jgi:hypothetical protein
LFLQLLHRISPVLQRLNRVPQYVLLVPAKSSGRLGSRRVLLDLLLHISAHFNQGELLPLQLFLNENDRFVPCWWNEEMTIFIWCFCCKEN